MDSMATRIYGAAKHAFGIPAVYKAWPMISNAYEALLWDKFNESYGPLTREQLDIIEDHVKDCIVKAGDAENPYASFRFHMNAAITDPALASRVLAKSRYTSLNPDLPALQGMPFDEA